MLKAMGAQGRQGQDTLMQAARSSQCMMWTLCLQELTLVHPNVVNSKKNTELLYSGPTFLGSHQ